MNKDLRRGIGSLDEAYRKIAEEMMSFADGFSWEYIVGIYKITPTSVFKEWSMFVDGGISDQGEFPQENISMNSTEGLKFIRKNIFEISGSYIWGARFTLHSDGRFEIDYSYDKPEGYDENDMMTGEEVNASLNDVLDKKFK